MVYFSLISCIQIIIIICSQYGWLLAKEPRCSRYHSTWSNSISKWYSRSSWLCSFKKTQVWSLFRYTIHTYWSIHHIIFIFLHTLDRGNATCAGRSGSLGYEIKDANTYAFWGVDYLKLDSCNLNGTATELSYSIMRDALNASGRPIFYSLCGMHINC